jgi:catechol 2,3-dioxygenase-like lactoylglutathione lyase family enzyme
VSENQVGPGTDAPEGGEFVARTLEAALTVRDLAASVAWYRDVVGFSLGQEFRREGRLFAARVQAGAVHLLLAQDDGARGEDRVKGEGVSLQLTTTQDVDEIAARIHARGGVLATEPFDAFGKRAFRLLDPDGFRITISSPQLNLADVYAEMATAQAREAEAKEWSDAVLPDAAT